MGVLAWSPAGFWDASVYDVERALEGWRRANNLSDNEADTPEDAIRRRAWFDTLPEIA